MRHWLSRRAAFTRPNFGTAINMSNTFAVETNSGGSPRICSIETEPDFRSFFSRARLTRMSFALLSASIRWSSERTGACTCVCGGTMSAASYQPIRRAQRVDERAPVRTRRLDRAHGFAHVPGMRGNLGVERLCGHVAARADDLCRRLRGLVDVRAGKVELDARDVVARELFARLCILARSEATYRNPDWNPELAQSR